MPRRHLFVLTTANPLRVSYRETLEMALVLAAFEQEVTLLYRGDGVLRLLRGQDPSVLGSKDHSRMSASFADHGIREVCALEEDLRVRGLDPDRLLLPVRTLDGGGMRRLLESQDFVLQF